MSKILKSEATKLVHIYFKEELDQNELTSELNSLAQKTINR